MRGQKKIVIDIDPEGNCSIDGEGFVGTECAHFLEEIEEALGQKISQTNKPEYRQRETTRGRNIQKGGR
jgi:hypothetical protein